MIDLKKITPIIKDFLSKVSKEDFLEWLALDEARDKKEFIRDGLDRIASVIPVKLSYVYDERYSQHVICVSPHDTYSSLEFEKLEVGMQNRFITKYPYADITFVTEKHNLILPEFEFTIDSLSKK